MKRFIITLLVVLGVTSMTEASEFYSFKVPDINGATLNFETFKGKAVLVVNVASRCGFTSQYDALQSLYESKKDNGLVILGVPSNDFMQELKTDEDIAEFCRANYGVTFPMTTKLKVRRSPVHPLYAFLQSSNPDVTNKVSWNFNKYLVSKEGKVLAHYGSRVKPDSAELVSAVKTELGIQ